MNFRSLTLMGLMAMAAVSSADSMFSFDRLVSGALPVGTTPYATLELQNVATDQVKVTLKNTMAASTGQFISRMWLNLSAIPSNFSIVSQASTIDSINWGSNTFNNTGYTFDLQMRLPTSNAGDGRLEGGESASFTLRGTGLTAQNLLTTSNGPSGPLVGLVHIQAINGNDSAKVGAVPEPATLTALGLGAVALLRRRRAK